MSLQHAAHPKSLENGVLVRCRPYLFAISTKYVERLLLTDDVMQPRQPRQSEGSPTPILVVDSHPYAVWDLGEMLELNKQSDAWVLLRVPGFPGEGRIALRTGQCLAVRPLQNTITLSPGIFKARKAALGQVFPVGEVLGLEDEALIGYYLDLPSFWSLAEMEASAAAFAEVEREREQGSSKHGAT